MYMREALLFFHHFTDDVNDLMIESLRYIYIYRERERGQGLESGVGCSFIYPVSCSLLGIFGKAAEA
jgi:hypothetical protein